MFKRIIFLIILFPLVLFIVSCSQKYEKICIKGICLKAELALTQDQRNRGLMYRDRLKDTEAMLFIFPEERILSFWMKNMRFPLDIIWLNKEKVIVDISNDLSPCDEYECASISPNAKAKFVIEVTAGFVQKNKILVGDKVEF